MLKSLIYPPISSPLWGESPRLAPELNFEKATLDKRIGVVGTGPAGVAAAIGAAVRGYRVMLFEATDRIGGQLNLARKIPGKEVFEDLLRYWRTQIERLGIEVRLNHRASVAELTGFDENIVAAGVRPLLPAIDGIDHVMVMNYADLLSGAREAGHRVAVVGAGGIGVDVARYLVEHGHQITQLRRSVGSMGADDIDVERIAGVTYLHIDDGGLHIAVGGERRKIECDSVIVCAGQVSRNDLIADFEARDRRAHIVGGARLVDELDVARAIEDGLRLAVSL